MPISKILSVSLVFFVVALSDSVMAFWIPGFMQNTTGSALLMGIIMGFSSVVGVASDVLLPRYIKNTSLRRIFLFAIFTCILFSVVMFASTYLPFVLLFLLGVALWGVYFELLSFARHIFIAGATTHKYHTAGAALLGVFISLAYTVGPLIAGILLKNGDRSVLIGAISLSFIAIALAVFLLPGKKGEAEDGGGDNITKEIRHYGELIGYVWPVVVAGFLFGIIDAVFWTSGTVLSEQMAQNSPLGSFVVPAYMFPSIFMGLVLVKLRIYEHKKKLSEIALFLAGTMLVMLSLTSNAFTTIIIILASSVFFSISRPLMDGVNADFNERMGRRQSFNIGLTNASFSMAYIIGPVLSGLFSTLFGERSAIALVGLFVAAVSFVLIITTPRKIRLPESKIVEW